MSADDRELPTDRLSTADATGKRIFLYPTEVNGTFRKWRDAVHAILIFVFLFLPWLHIGGRQLFLLDIDARKFTLFGVTFWAHDAPLLVFVFAGGAVILFFVTALWGRVWCGWACPQTVFIDSFFRRIERWVEGDSVTRKLADAQPLNAARLARKLLKWTLFILASLVITHSFLAYFIDTKVLTEIVRRSPVENPVAFTAMLVLSGLVLFDFAWFREQFCTIACPYGRFQSFLMDEHSLLIGYDAKRGEPRKGFVPTGGTQGDCINCYRCVQVCPTGIDIRRGLQLECIACTACADACDDVMQRLHKPKGLIRYSTMVELEGNKTKWLRPRVLAYLAAMVVIFAALGATLLVHEPVQATFLRAVDVPYTEVQSGAGEPSIMNRFKIDLANQSDRDLALTIELAEEWKTKHVTFVVPVNPVPVAAGKMMRIDLFVTFPRGLLKAGKLQVPVSVTPSDSSTGIKPLTEDITLVGPIF